MKPGLLENTKLWKSVGMKEFQGKGLRDREGRVNNDKKKGVVDK